MQDISAYITEAKSRGMSGAEIREALEQAGWHSDEIANVLIDQARDDLTAPPPPHVQNSSRMKQDTAWSLDKFQYVLMFISLQITAVSLTLVLHQLITHTFGAAARYSYTGSYNNTILQIYASALIVSFPLFAFLFAMTEKKVLLDPMLKKSQSRKEVVYVSLVIAFLVVIGYVISLVYHFLTGNITGDFLLNFVATVVIYGAMFSYFLNQVKDDRK